MNCGKIHMVNYELDLGLAGNEDENANKESKLCENSTRDYEEVMSRLRGKITMMTEKLL